MLLVHGIGRQKAGEAIDQVGNAMLTWFKAQLGEDAVAVERAVLKPKERGDKGLARAVLRIETTDRAKPKTRRILLAESRWAEEFDPPGFYKVLGWTLGPGAWLLFKYIVTRPLRLIEGANRQRPLSQNLRVTISGLVGVLSIFVVLLPVQLLGILLALLYLIPFEPAKKAVQSLVLTLSEQIGDSYLFASNPIVRKALADRVASDLDALEDLAAAKTIIVAHSQGAAVTMEMAQARTRRRPLVTYGAGIRKLYELTEPQHSPGWFIASVRLIALVWLVSIVLVVGDVQQVATMLASSSEPVVNRAGGLGWIGIIAIYLIGFILGGKAADSHVAIDRMLAPKLANLAPSAGDWLDLYSSHDPVPDGPLQRSAKPSERDGFNCLTGTTGELEWRKVVCEMNAIRDHNTYWDSSDGFIEPIVHWLRLRHALTWLPEPQARPWILRRETRTVLRYAISWALAVGVILLWVTAWQEWRSILPAPDDVSDWLNTGLPDWLVFAQATIARAIGYTYPLLSAIAMLVVHLAALSVFETGVTGAAWKRFDDRVKLNVPDSFGSWLRTGLAFVLYLAIVLLVGFSLYHAITAGSYQPLWQTPVDIVLWLHELAFPAPPGMSSTS